MGQIYSTFASTVGDGKHVRFWHDHWCGNHSLKNLYLALYACLVVKDASLHFIWVSLVDGVEGVGTSSSTGFLVLMTRN